MTKHSDTMTEQTVKEGKRTADCKATYPETDPIVEGVYSDLPYLKLSEEIKAFMNILFSAACRKVSADIKCLRAMPKKTTDQDRLFYVLKGGWTGLTADPARNFNGAFKVETLVVLDGYADTLVISVETATGHTGDGLVTLVPSVSRERYYCADCATTGIVGFDRSEPWADKQSVACFNCHQSMKSGYVVTTVFHVNTGRKVTVQRRCCDSGCPDMHLRGVVVGYVQDITPEIVLESIRRLRAYVGSSDGLEILLNEVKAQEQFDAKVPRAMNLWNGQPIKRDKITAIRTSL